MRTLSTAIVVAAVFSQISFAADLVTRQFPQTAIRDEIPLAGPPLVVIIGGGDCNDTDSEVYPGHAEVPLNRYDDDCDGLADEDLNNVPSNDTSDSDSDGVTIQAGDCDDRISGIRPGAIEIVGNLVDDDCDGLADEDANNNPSLDEDDHDHDGYFIRPDALFRSGFESGM
jgi:hypothetical protein